MCRKVVGTQSHAIEQKNITAGENVSAMAEGKYRDNFRISSVLCVRSRHKLMGNEEIKVRHLIENGCN
jgi:hypothetical protein